MYTIKITFLIGALLVTFLNVCMTGGTEPLLPSDPSTQQKTAVPLLTSAQVALIFSFLLKENYKIPFVVMGCKEISARCLNAIIAGLPLKELEKNIPKVVYKHLIKRSHFVGYSSDSPPNNNDDDFWKNFFIKVNEEATLQFKKEGVCEQIEWRRHQYIHYNCITLTCDKENREKYLNLNLEVPFELADLQENYRGFAS